jgi:hypothetical protein
MACLALSALTAQAQNTRSWVSAATGNNASLCTRAAPCQTFAGALAKTNAGGTINCVDAGEFGSLSIAKSITIDCTGTFAAVQATSGVAIALSSTSATDVVRLRGLSIEGMNAGAIGIAAGQIGALRIEQCKIFGFTSAGIQFSVSGSVGAELYVSDSVISENAVVDPAGFASGIGIEVQDTSTARVSLSNVKLDNNFFGLAVRTGTGSTGRISLSMRDSTTTGNSQVGIQIGSQDAFVVAALDNVTTTANSTGLSVISPATRVLITRLTAIANFNGLQTIGGGVVVSYGDNHINNNINANGMPTAVQTPQ